LDLAPTARVRRPERASSTGNLVAPSLASPRRAGVIQAIGDMAARIVAALRTSEQASKHLTLAPQFR
jgi:hypothetical protein